MYKKILWLSALTACFVTGFFAILSFTKVNEKAIAYGIDSACSKIANTMGLENSQTAKPHIPIQPRQGIHCCPQKEDDKEIQPRTEQQEDKKCPHNCPHNCPHHKQERVSLNFENRNCVKELADDSTEDNLLIAPQCFEQQRHLPFFKAKKMHIFNFMHPFFENLPFENTFDLNFKNAFTIEIVENRDDNSWHFYINGQEVQPNSNSSTESNPENKPMPLPELNEDRPIVDNSQTNTDSNTSPELPQQPEDSANAPQNEPNKQPEDSTPPQPNTGEESTLLPEATPYI